MREMGTIDWITLTRGYVCHPVMFEEGEKYSSLTLSLMIENLDGGNHG